MSRRFFTYVAALALCAFAPLVAPAQPKLNYDELDKLVRPVALYPDPILAQVLMAASYFDQIADAAKWSDQHHYLTGAALAAAIAGDHLPWDQSVQALLPFPWVLERLAEDLSWTTQLGTAVLSQLPELMDAIQRDRHKAVQFGYLASNKQVLVSRGPIITIMASRTGMYFIPVYDPAVVFVPPAPRFAVGTAVDFGVGVDLPPVFRPWWEHLDIGWDGHILRVGDVPWKRTWANRLTYFHKYPYSVARYTAAQRVETHELLTRSEKEKEADRLGKARMEEHHAK